MAEHDLHFPTASSAQSSDIHADPPQDHGAARTEDYDDDGILLDSAAPSRQVQIPTPLKDFLGPARRPLTRMRNILA